MLLKLWEAGRRFGLLARSLELGTRLLLFTSILILLALPLKAGTKIVHRWVLTGQPMPKLNKILVIGVMEN
ncbi:MAG TPA: hypothetical protein VMI32_12405 [Candidatus Solibacter sp.]|nr:hypothetical protein [Candidatus Solibacter sp.]